MVTSIAELIERYQVFGDKSITVEDLMKEKGELFKKGTLSEDGDIEFWQDGTTTKRVKAQQEDLKSTLKRGWVPVELSPESRPGKDVKNANDIDSENQSGVRHQGDSERAAETKSKKIE